MKRIWIAAAAAAALILLPGWASAYFSAENDQNNLIDIGSVTTEIIEDFPDPGDLEPGGVITKVVRIRSTGKTDCYVRAQVLFSDSETEELCRTDYNTQDWTYEKDGWWYYRSVLHTGEITEPLFTEVTVSDEAEEINGFCIYVRQESRQAEGNDNVPWT